jgi:hypothetical protein
METQENKLYSDGLLTITSTSLVFHNYYFFGLSKTVKIEDIQEIYVKEPTVWNGKWRLWGSGRLDMWFPMDFTRPGRDRIFHVKMKNSNMLIGFTVKDSKTVENILRQLSLIK